MSLALLFHCLMLNMFWMLIHPSSGACDLFVELFRGLYCSGTVCVGVTLWYPYGDWSLYKDTTPPQPNHNVTPTHVEPEQYNPWNNSTYKWQAPEDGCTNIWNMLSIKYWNNKASYIKLVYLYSSTIIHVHCSECYYGVQLQEYSYNFPKWIMHRILRKIWRKESDK